METSNYLGIYLKKEAATVVCLGSGVKGKEVLGVFSVTVDKGAEDSMRQMSAAIAKGCEERGLKFSEVYVGLDCEMFMQHDVHSAFKERKQVGSTVRYDTEEAIATDVSNLAIGYKIISSDENGSDLVVFTVERDLLAETILGLQANGLDPAVIEPDISCLSHFIKRNVPSEGVTEGGTFYAVLSDSRGYFLIFSGSGQELRMRTFLLSGKGDRGGLLRREIPLSLALVKGEHNVRALKIYDAKGSVNSAGIGGGGLEGGDIDVSFLSGLSSGQEGVGIADLAIAYGAAAGYSVKSERINFRNDFMPYLARKKQMEKAVKFVSICVTAAVLSAGIYFQAKLYRIDRPRQELVSRMEKDYQAVMPGKKLARGADPVKKLEAEKRRLEDLKSGVLSVTGEKSVTAKLTMVLEAFNKSAAETNLRIEKINISNRNITIAGDTSSRANTLKFFEAIKQSKMEMVPNNVTTKKDRDVFTMTATPIK